jgi:CysZ protein
MTSHFLKGFSFVFIGRSSAKKIPGLFYWILFPFLIDLVLLFLGVYFGLGYVKTIAVTAILWLFSNSDSIYAQIAYYPLLIILGIGFLILLVFATYILASVIASPFYGVLAEKTLVHFKVIEDRSFDWRRFLKQTSSMIVVSFKRGVILACIGLLLFFCSFIPVLNIFAAYSAFVLMAMDSADFALEAKGLHLKQRLAYFKQNYKLFLGQGAFVGLTLIIPGLILLIMPYAVIGSTVLMAENENKRVLP